jgi:MFS family permease
MEGGDSHPVEKTRDDRFAIRLYDRPVRPGEYLGPLTERPFRLLWLARTTSSIGDAMVPVATSFAVLEIGSASDLGLVLAAFMGGRMVFMLVGGVWADRLPRRFLMIASDAVRAVVQSVIALAFLTGAVEVWQLALSSAIFGIASAFFGPASTGLVPQLVSRTRVQEANALLDLSRNATELFGPALAGVLVATVGYSLIFAIDAASFVASLSCLALLPRLPRLHARAQSFIADAREGVREVLKRPWMRVTLVADAVGNFAFAPYFVLGPLVVREHGGASRWGVMMAAAAAGGILGGVVALRWKPQRPLVPGYALLYAIPLALLSLVPPAPLPVLMLAAALLTGSIFISNTFWQTMEQQHVPNAVLGRVDSFAWMVALVFLPIAFAISGPIAEWLGVRETLLIAAGLQAMSTTCVLLARSVRELRRVEDVTPEPARASDSEDESPDPALPVQPL